MLSFDAVSEYLLISFLGSDIYVYTDIVHICIYMYDKCIYIYELYLYPYTYIFKVSEKFKRNVKVQDNKKANVTC